MNVLAINASPNADKGNTALILRPFLEGTEDAGGRVQVLYTKRLRINPCRGEFNCPSAGPETASSRHRFWATRS